MSSRALRKLQREQEEQKQLKELREDGEETDSQEEAEGLSESKLPAPKQLNAFDMLGTDEGLSGEEAEASDSAQVSDAEDTLSGTAVQQENMPRTPLKDTKTKSKTRNKKKNKKKQRGKDEETEGSKSSIPPEKSKLDDIDLALKSLSTKPGAQEASNQDKQLDESYKQMYRLLATDSKNLNALNEMRRLFGNVVLEGENEGAGTPGQGRRRGRGPQQLDLGGALAGRHSPVSRGQGLAGLALRRNIFMLGKEEWPKATSGGLGMEVVEKPWDGTTEYRYVHNAAYQDIQRQFHSCVESMEPQRMVQLLQFNPYHVSTLLQVSEIAKQQGDHSVSGDLLERTLFSFGRSVHSSFPSALAEGKARLDFRRPENREFWLACWRYISNLGQRGTWRTTYEWAKLLLSLDPEGDPYCIGLILAQLALRGGQGEHFINLSMCSLYYEQWAGYPNVQISIALAEYKLKRAQSCRSSLSKAVKSYPWIFARLLQELNVSHISKSIWGKQPRTEREKFESELYVTRAKDLWNTPENISLLVEVTETLEAAPSTIENDTPITLNEARHVLLSDTPALISLLPRKFTTMQTSSSDPLPPPDDLPSYDPISPMNPHHGLDRVSEPLEASPAGTDEAQELRGLQSFFARIIPWLGLRRPPNTTDDSDSDAIDQRTVEEIDRAVQESGVPPEVIEERGARMLELQRRMLQQQENEIQAQAQAFPQEQDAITSDREGPDLSSLMEPDPETVAERPDLSSAIHPVPPTGSSPLPSTPTITTDANTSAPTPPDPYDDERNQRWLAGQGLLRLRDFVTAHGADETTWQHDPTIDASPVDEYADRVLLLRRRATRNFILDYVLQQGTSAQVREMVLRVVQGRG